MKKKYEKPTIKIKTIEFNFFYSKSRSQDSLLMVEGLLAWDNSCADTCFLPSSKVLMDDGTQKNIEEIKVDELIYSFNLTAEKLVKNKVDKVIEKTYKDGYLIINGLLKPTLNHRLWVNNNEWVKAEEIKVGDKLLDSGGNEIIVEKIEKVKGVFTVYNLHLTNKEHNFFVENILVHNPLCE